MTKERLYYTLPGVYLNEEANRIWDLASGETYMNFCVEYGGTAGNNTVIVSSDNAESEEELRDFFLWYMMTAK